MTAQQIQELAGSGGTIAVLLYMVIQIGRKLDVVASSIQEHINGTRRLHDEIGELRKVIEAQMRCKAPDIPRIPKERTHGT